jgi:HEAT repeat protein
MAQLLDMIDDKNPEVRVHAIQSLVTFGRKEALPLLIGLFNDSDSKVVSAARIAVNRLNSISDKVEGSDPQK